MNDVVLKTLLVEASKGNIDAFHEIARMYRPLLKKYSIVQGKVDEDLLQDLILYLYCNISKFSYDVDWRSKRKRGIS